jgi:hypothetical protein
MTDGPKNFEVAPRRDRARPIHIRDALPQHRYARTLGHIVGGDR